MLGAPLRRKSRGRGTKCGQPKRRTADRSSGTPWSRERVGPFTVLPRPGHATDHVCFLIDDVTLCGDLILGHGSSFVPPAPGAPTDYMESLERLQAASRAALSRPRPMDHRPAAKIAEYMAHRLKRERKLVAALDGGERSAARLLAAAGTTSRRLLPAAAIAMRRIWRSSRTRAGSPRALRDC